MEENQSKCPKNKNKVVNGIVEGFKMHYPKNLTILDLSDKSISLFDENMTFPPHLSELNLSRNQLSNIPGAVLELKGVKLLDLSHNKIEYFDEYPNFCDIIEELNLSNNRLSGPPYWIWAEAPPNLVKLDISSNPHLTDSLTESYLAELLQYKTLIKEVFIYNCRINNKVSLELLGTFNNAKRMEIGLEQLSIFSSNLVHRVPCEGLDMCSEVERLNLSNTRIYSIEPNINIYKNLVEINLSLNKITGIPSNFCDLDNLEVCILSNNSILYLPDEMVKLKKLICLRLDCNQICTVQATLCLLPNLKTLDLYDNCLNEVPSDIMAVEELDLSQNFLEEPNSEEYLVKKERLRLNVAERTNGRKKERTPVPSEHSPSTTDDEELLEYLDKYSYIDPTPNNGPPSSPEDWDSEEYWTPGFPVNRTLHPREHPWLTFAKRMMNAGNFCPMDLHLVSVEDSVRYNNLCNPKRWPIANGQFEDYPDDNSRVLRLKRY